MDRTVQEFAYGAIREGHAGKDAHGTRLGMHLLAIEVF